MTTDSATPASRQFTVRYLFLLTAIVALSLLPVAHWGVWGIFPSVWLVTIGACALHKRYAFAGWLFAIIAVGAFLLSAVNNTQPAPRRAVCQNNLRHIALAIADYEADNGHLPPPYTTDDNGNPLHSWRVLILPYMEEQALYDAIDLSKPWHHPHNLALATRMPPVYRCPSFGPNSRALGVTTTAYVAIIGDHTAWPRSGKRRLKDIIDRRSNTLSVLESETHRLHWMSTADPGIEMIGRVNGDGETFLSRGPHNGFSACAFCDGFVQWLPDDFDFNHLRALTTVDGAESPGDTR
jgi:hypothetical protein